MNNSKLSRTSSRWFFVIRLPSSLCYYRGRTDNDHEQQNSSSNQTHNKHCNKRQAKGYSTRNQVIKQTIINRRPLKIPTIGRYTVKILQIRRKTPNNQSANSLPLYKKDSIEMYWMMKIKLNCFTICENLLLSPNSSFSSVTWLVM